MGERLVLALGRQVGRRRFLKKAAVSVGAALLSILGLPREVQALYHVRCCWLCQPEGGPCSGCACTWSWLCDENGTVWRCIECHSNTSYCGSGCTNVYCSHAQKTGYAPEALAPQAAG
jgi:hypothetical protein